jgi:hypothetical protein
MAAVKISAHDGQEALDAWRLERENTPSHLIATAVRFTLQLLAERSPGASLEVRVPPFGAVQCLEGSRHTRGTPPNVVEMTPELWLPLAIGELTWADALHQSSLSASGVRATLEGLLPVVTREAETPEVQ